MKLAYLIYPEAVVLGESNGIRSQALSWATALRDRGWTIDLIDTWGTYRWSEYDVIHVFGGYHDLSWISQLRARNEKVVFSPIWDSNMTIARLKFYRKLNFPVLHHSLIDYSHVLKSFKAVFVRSEFEKERIAKGLGVDVGRIIKVPLGFKMDAGYYNPRRKDICFHVSTLYQPRKNVVRLIQAARKYHFKLVLAGTHGTEEEFGPIRRAIDGAENITVLGFLPEQELLDYYRCAKVFALPSVAEGVGLVALDAGVMGANVVITKAGGPGEYYKGMAYLVDPYSIDDIGTKICKAMRDEWTQPHLRDFLISEYSESRTACRLMSAYESLS